MAILNDLRSAPDSRRLTAALVLVLFCQALLPLPAHTRLAEDGEGAWRLVCTLAAPAAGGEEETPAERPAPGILFAQAAAELLRGLSLVMPSMFWRYAGHLPATADQAASTRTFFSIPIRAPPAG